MPAPESVVVVGLTGGIATGKSTVSNMFRELGARVIDADIVAREVVEAGSPALVEIRDAFGDGVFDVHGRLDREALGAIVFSDRAARSRLNSITHPRIGLRMMELANEAREAGFGWVIYDAALIVENGLHRMFGGLIVVACSPGRQLRRLMERDECDEAQAQARIDSQLPLADKVAVADWVIDNDGTLGETRTQVEGVFGELVRRHGPVSGV